MPEPDPELLRRAYQQDRGLLHALPKRLKAIQDSEDAIQDVWLHLAERRPAASAQPINPRSYLAKSVINAITGYLRRDRRRNEVHKELASILDGGGTDVSPERALAGKQALNAVAQALDALPEQTRRIFLLNRVEGHTYVEISRRLAISEQTVHYHMRRAIDHLAPLRKEIYESDAGPYG